MSNNEFIENEFVPDAKQMQLIENFKKLRKLFGTPDNLAYLKARERTSKFTRTVYPPGNKV